MDLPSGLPDILASMMQNPEIMKTVSSLAENISLPSSEEKSGQESPENSSTPAEEPIGGINIPPELIAQLPSIMSALSGSGRSNDYQGEKQDKKGSYDSQRKALLHALRPFLSEKRCAVIDSILKFESLAGVINGFTDKKT